MINGTVPLINGTVPLIMKKEIIRVVGGTGAWGRSDRTHGVDWYD